MRKLTALIAAVAAFTLLAATLMVSPASAQDARVTLLHGIPGITVDVQVDGEVIISDLEFGDREDLSALSGQTLVDMKVLAAGTDAVAIDQGDLLLPAEGNYTAVAHLDPDGEPMLTIFRNDVSPIDAGDGRLTVRHTAAAGPVDIKLDGVAVINGLSTAKEASADLSAATMSVEVVLDGEDTVIVGPVDVDLIEGESLAIYAVGGLDDDATVLTETISFGAIETDEDGEDDTAETTDDDEDGAADEADDDEAAEEVEEDTAMNSAPTGVETGNSPITATTFPLLAVTLGVLAFSLAGGLGLRRSGLLD